MTGPGPPPSLYEPGPVPHSRSRTLMTIDALVVRRRRIAFRAWHRGTREMDLIMGRYADAHVADFDDPALDRLEALMEEAGSRSLQLGLGQGRATAQRRRDTSRATAGLPRNRTDQLNGQGRRRARRLAGEGCRLHAPHARAARRHGAHSQDARSVPTSTSRSRTSPTGSMGSCWPISPARSPGAGPSGRPCSCTCRPRGPARPDGPRRASPSRRPTSRSWIFRPGTARPTTASRRMPRSRRGG